MIPSKARIGRKAKGNKLSKNIERLYKEGKCRECSVVVTRMDFAKILGKFTKVKIQYESSETPKSKENSKLTSNSRIKTSENGIRQSIANRTKNEISTTRQASNVLKENNGLKSNSLKDDYFNYNNSKTSNANFKRYGIIFEDPSSNNRKDFKSKTSLEHILPEIDNSILPSEEWSIEYFPSDMRPKDDKVYNRIAAELEDLMYNEKPNGKTTSNKVDEFPSIMEILNDTSENIVKKSGQSDSMEMKSNFETSDVEAMLLGKSSLESATAEPTSMDVDNAVSNSLIDDVDQISAIQSMVNNSQANEKEPLENSFDNIENPHSPSILDETLQKGIEEHLPTISEHVESPILNDGIKKEKISDDIASHSESSQNSDLITGKQNENTEVNIICKDKENKPIIANITQVIFKKTKDGQCYKSVTCLKNLKYSIMMEGKTVEFLGAPNFISSLEDLVVLLQIVNESELQSLYVLHSLKE